MGKSFGPRRAVWIDIAPKTSGKSPPFSEEELANLERFDLIFRALCAILYNYAPTSGHPGGSISSGRIVACLMFDSLDYDAAQPGREDADVISYAAGHKAMGLYSLWALRNEVMRIGAPEMLPAEQGEQLRLEDLLGFRRNRIAPNPLFRSLRARPLDGHPTPATPFVRLATGASGVGLGSSVGLAIGARDYFGDNSPMVHVIEGEGGLTPGRASEALAAAGTCSLGNLVLHVDWNQASIDSDRVCREGETVGDYVQWDPAELAFLHDWNVIMAPEGMDFLCIAEAQRAALRMDNGQPTAIVYRTVKGKGYGIEGRASHGLGHGLCADGFYEALRPLCGSSTHPLKRCESANKRCREGSRSDVLEECFWDSLMVIREEMEKSVFMVKALGARLRQARDRLDRHARTPRSDSPRVDAIYRTAALGAKRVPGELRLSSGDVTTLRAELGKALGYFNAASGGALLCASADLLGSTSLSAAVKGFPEGYYNARKNPRARVLPVGGICEDAMSAILSGISTFGRAIGVGSSYAGFLAPLGHVASRLHAIGSQAKGEKGAGPYNPVILVCAHAGLKTGEDGPTHADPQALQLLQENFPLGTCVTLTPLEPREVWFLLAAALARRPAIIAPFVTRPNETVIDRDALGLAPAAASPMGVYRLRAAKGRKPDGFVVLQGSEVGYAFLQDALPLIEKHGIDLEVYYVSSAELFDLLPPAMKRRTYPHAAFENAFGITGFTLPTMFKWIGSTHGREHSLHPFKKGRYLGSGSGRMVMEEAGLDGNNQFRAMRKFLDGMTRARGR